MRGAHGAFVAAVAGAEKKAATTLFSSAEGAAWSFSSNPSFQTHATVFGHHSHSFERSMEQPVKAVSKPSCGGLRPSKSEPVPKSKEPDVDLRRGSLKGAAE